MTETTALGIAVILLSLASIGFGIAWWRAWTAMHFWHGLYRTLVQQEGAFYAAARQTGGESNG